MNRAATIRTVAIFCIVIQSSVCSSSWPFALCQEDGSLKSGTYWTLSSKWKWNASGTGDEAGWRVEREDWNDTLSIDEVSSSELRLGLKRVGRGALEASGSFIIGGLQSDSWRIDRQYSLRVNASTFRDPDGKLVRWIINVKALDASGSVPQMWIDENYVYVEVEFQVSGSELIRAGGFTLDTWAVSYRNVTTGYWSAGGNHSTGFKEETLEYEKRYGLLLQAEYTGRYGIKTSHGGWNETETFVASTVDSNLRSFAELQDTNQVAVTAFAAALVAIGVIVFTVFLHKRRRPDLADRH